MVMAKTYDVKCWDLAGHFLQDYPLLQTKQAQHALACDIQQAVEDFLDTDLASDGIQAVSLDHVSDLHNTLKRILGE